MATVRPAVLSGTWYPGPSRDLAAAVDGYLSGAEPERRPQGRAHLVVAPHAGYVYSGATAGRVYGLLRGERLGRVFVLAPSHRVRLDRVALSGAAAFATPLGEVPVDRDAVRDLAADPAFAVDDRAHEREHAVEIQLPFLQRALAPGFRLVPLLVPPLPAERRRAAAAALQRLRRDDDLVVVSTDFTHYGDSYGYVPFRTEIADRLEQLDAGAILRVLGHDAEGLIAYGRETGITMCGLDAAALAISGPAPAGYEAELLDYRRSGDRDGDHALSVSYAAIMLTAPGLTRAESDALLALARRALEAAVRGDEPPDPQEAARAGGGELTPALLAKRGAFVTLTRRGELRGCIGYIEPVKPLAQAVIENARSAALADPRFAPVRPAELADIRVEISALTPLRDVSGPDQIRLGRHGILLRKGLLRAVFLPQVAPEQGWDLTTTLEHLALKAGLPRDGWRSGATFATFEAEILEEPPR
ncbi:MAG: AmmeMemoRadiSam system protein B [Candidatus Krumholzibacteriia bacterium]